MSDKTQIDRCAFWKVFLIKSRQNLNINVSQTECRESSKKMAFLPGLRHFAPKFNH
jgi:hypothetical protein